MGIRETIIKGNFEWADMPLFDVLQVVYSTRKTGTLDLKVAGQDGQIIFKNGQIKYARFNDLLGREALLSLLKNKNGTFRLANIEQEVESNIFEDTGKLILQLFREVDP